MKQLFFAIVALCAALGSMTARAERPAGRFVVCDRGDAGISFRTDYSLSESFFERLQLIPAGTPYAAKTGKNIICTEGPPLYKEWNGQLNHECSFALSADLSPLEARLTQVDESCREDWVSLDTVEGDQYLNLRGPWAEEMLGRLSGGKPTAKREWLAKGALKCGWIRVMGRTGIYAPKRTECRVRVSPAGEILSW
ncbi:MAG: hypothetical protein ABL958_19845 [Bdellovibrionia bacterium]